MWPGLAVEPHAVNDGGSCHLPLAAGASFEVRFLHSVDRLPVRDRYRVVEGQLIQHATHVREFGAGMGHLAGHGRGRAADGGWEIVGMHRAVGDLVLRVGDRHIDHRLHHPGGQLALSTHWPGQRVIVRPQRQSTVGRLLHALRGADCPTGSGPVTDHDRAR